MSISPDHDSPAWQILEYLQRNPSATIKDFELLLGVTTTAVRQHLNALQASGYLDRREERSGVGRPHYIYVATDAARELFACRCDDLALTMLQEMYGMVGAEKMGTLLKRVGVSWQNGTPKPSTRPVCSKESRKWPAPLPAKVF